jgi:hypothetical protein
MGGMKVSYLTVNGNKRIRAAYVMKPVTAYVPHT